MNKNGLRIILDGGDRRRDGTGVDEFGLIAFVPRRHALLILDSFFIAIQMLSSRPVSALSSLYYLLFLHQSNRSAHMAKPAIHGIPA